MDTNDFDVIVIGSGIGGLTAARCWAQLAGKRVLVLERHFRLGGFTHGFQRRGYRWDVGLHYVGGMGRGMRERALMDMVTGGRVDWSPMPANFDHFHYPASTSPCPTTRRSIGSVWASALPSERDAIATYFRDVRRAADWYGLETWSWSAPAGSRANLAAGRLRALGDYF